MTVTETIQRLGGLARLTADVRTDGRLEGDPVRAVEAAAQRCCSYAPDAPTAILREAVVRMATYSATRAGIRSESAGPLEVQYNTNPGIFSASGARGLLSPYRVRRAMPV